MAKDKSKDLHHHVVSFFTSKLQAQEALKSPTEQKEVTPEMVAAHVASNDSAADEFKNFVEGLKHKINPGAWARVKEEFEEALSTL